MSKITKIIIIILLFCQIFSIFFIYKQYTYYKQKNIINDSLVFQYSDLGIKDMKISYFYNEEENAITSVDFVFAGKQYHKEYFGGFYNAIFYNNLEFTNPTLVIITGEAQTVYTYMLEFSNSTNTFNEIKFVDKDGSVSDSMCCNFMLLVPKKDGIHYDIGMPDFSSKIQEIQQIPKITKYSYNKEKYSFVESD